MCKSKFDFCSVFILRLQSSMAIIFLLTEAGPLSACKSRIRIFILRRPNSVDANRENREALSVSIGQP